MTLLVIRRKHLQGQHDQATHNPHTSGFARPELVDEIDDLTSVSSYPGQNTFSYFIAPNDQLLDINSEEISDEVRGEHADVVVARPDWFGLNANDYVGGNRYTPLSDALDNGYIRVRQVVWGDEMHVAIETAKVDTPTLRRLQRLYDANKLFIGDETTWDSRQDALQFDMAEFFDAHRVVIEEDRAVLKHLPVEEKEYSTAIIAFNLMDDNRVRLAQSGLNQAEIVEDVHITLLFLGGTQELEKIGLSLDVVRAALENLAATQAPIEGNITGAAIFDRTESSGWKYPYVLLYDSPQLPFLRTALHSMVRSIVPNNKLVEQDHGFIPHITLGYITDRDTYVQPQSWDKRFDTIWLFWGNERYVYELTGTEILKHLPGQHDQQTHDPTKGGNVPSNSMVNALQDWYKEHAGGDAQVDDFVNVNRRSYGFIVDDTAVYMYPNINAGVIHGQWAEAVGGLPKLYEGGGVRYTYRPDQEWGILDLEFNWPLDAKAGDAISAFLYKNLDTIKEVEVDIHNTQNILGISHRYGVYKPEDFIEIVSSKVLKQLPIDDAGKTALISARIAAFQDEATALAERMYTGELSLGSWEEQMKALIRGLHSSTAAIGKGGWMNMTQSDWGKIGNPLKAQYRYLHGFAQDVADNAETIALGSVQRRARMYGDAVGQTAMLMYADYFKSYLPWMPRDGTTECLVSCKCEWRKINERLNKAKTKKTVTMVWKLNPAEHCVDCIDRDGYKVTFEVPANVQVPLSIGGFG